MPTRVTTGNSVASMPLEDIEHTDPAILADPFPYFKRLRAEAPVFRDPRTGIVAVSSYDLVLEVNRKPKIFSSKFNTLLKSGGVGEIDPEEAAILDAAVPWVPTMLTNDPPEHTRYKRLAMKAFTPKRVEAMSNYIRETVDNLIDDFIEDGSVEFKSRFADQLPSRIIADMLGVPREDIPQFQIWLRAALARLAGVAARKERIDAARKVIELERYFLDQFRRRRVNRTDDMLCDLIWATLEEEGDARTLNDSELMGITQRIFIAGQDTTSHALSYGLYCLILDADAMAAVREDHDKIPNFVEEVLRHLTPTNNMWRVVAQDTELGGVPLRKGEKMLLRYGAANRDERHFPNGEAFDINRPNARNHLAFGAGIHTCLGAALARKEMCAAFALLLARLDNIRVDPASDYAPDASILFRGVASLPIVFDSNTRQ